MKLVIVKKVSYILVRICVIAFVLLMLDGFLHRDPFARLDNGYGIGAICGSCPCFLWYEPWKDKRDFSEWKADIIDNLYLLNHEGSGESLEFESEDEWRQAWREKKAAPGIDAIPNIEGITGFKRKEQHVIGNYNKGFFILDMNNDLVKVWNLKEKTAWTAEVQSKTKMSVDNLTDPKSWFVQSRDLYYVLIIAAIIMFYWAFVPLWRKRKSRSLIEG